MASLLDCRDYVGTAAEGFYKTTLFQSERLLLGLNCLEAGQHQPVNGHENEDKFYLVLEGAGEFQLGDETQAASAGNVVWAPAGVSHGVTNTGSERLVLLMGMAPSPG